MYVTSLSLIQIGAVSPPQSRTQHCKSVSTESVKDSNFNIGIHANLLTSGKVPWRQSRTKLVPDVSVVVFGP
jgi:hypothetical protein